MGVKRVYARTVVEGNHVPRRERVMRRAYEMVTAQRPVS